MDAPQQPFESEYRSKFPPEPPTLAQALRPHLHLPGDRRTWSKRAYEAYDARRGTSFTAAHEAALDVLAEETANYLVRMGLGRHDTTPVRFEIVRGWLVEVEDGCTCGLGGPTGHEPSCGLNPIVALADLPGYDEFVAGLR